MFEHLDDQAPPAPEWAARQAVSDRMEKLRRRRTARAGAVALAVLVVLGVVASNAGRQPKPEVVPTVPPSTTTSTIRRPPVGVGGLLANLMEHDGRLAGWSLAFYPRPVEREPTTAWLSVFDPDGPVPRIVSVDYGDGRVVRPPNPPCPPLAAQPADQRSGEHWFHSARMSLGDPSPVWRHAFKPGEKLLLNVKVVAESGCGAPRRTMSTAEFEVHVFRPWGDS